MNKSLIKILITCISLLPVVLTGICYGGQPESENWPTVGIEASVQAILPRNDLMAMGVKDRANMILRVVSVTEKDGGYLYDLRYIGLLPGEYDLSNYLLMPDGSQANDLPPISVKVLALLPEGHQGGLVSNQLKALIPPGGYKLFFTVVWVLWVILLIPIIFAFRKKQTVIEEIVTPPPTLDQLLRPLVEKALNGHLDTPEKGHLERLLMGYWQQELSLDKSNVYEMLRQIKAHPEGGKLLESLESWLHRPPGTAAVDIDKLLSPYKNISVAPEKQEVTV